MEQDRQELAAFAKEDIRQSERLSFIAEKLERISVILDSVN